jgi:hypothetical protein
MDNQHDTYDHDAPPSQETFDSALGKVGDFMFLDNSRAIELTRGESKAICAAVIDGIMRSIRDRETRGDDDNAGELVARYYQRAQLTLASCRRDDAARKGQTDAMREKAIAAAPVERREALRIATEKEKLEQPDEPQREAGVDERQPFSVIVGGGVIGGPEISALMHLMMRSVHSMTSDAMVDRMLTERAKNGLANISDVLLEVVRAEEEGDACRKRALERVAMVAASAGAVCVAIASNFNQQPRCDEKGIPYGV